MADKEATVYIVDLGVSMNQTRGGRPETDLDWAMRYVWDKITATVATERKTATLGVVGLHTDETRNEMGDEEGFSNVSVLEEIGQLLLPRLKHLQRVIRPSSTNDGDAISAIVIAIQMITKYCKKNKWKKQIVLVTNGQGPMDADDMSEITSKLISEEIELLIIGIDFDDAEYGFKEESKDELKATNEATLRNLANDCHGLFGTMQQAIEELGIPRLKTTRPVPSYKGLLTIGNPDENDSAICIDVHRYPRVMIRRPLTASNQVPPSTVSNDQPSAESSHTLLHDAQKSPDITQSDTNSLVTVRNSRSYQVADATGKEGKRDVLKEDLARGYEYGRTAVHISESDQNVTRLETKQGLEIIGFIPWSKYERYMSMSISCMTIAERTNSKAIMALSSFIHALFELESYAVARLVPKPDKDPLVLLLAPSIEPDYECLLDVQLPFAEDFRAYKFPPLDRVVTVSGKEIRVHRNLPDEQLQSAMSDYVDKMDLSEFGQDDEGHPTEYAQITDTYSPVLHRIDQAVRWRATHPGEPIPPPYEILTRYSKPPEALVAKSKRQLDTLIARADVKKVPPKAKSRKRARNEVKPLSGLDVSALLSKKSGSSKKLQITHQNPIPEFRQALDKTKSAAEIQSLVDSFGLIIEERIKDSFGDVAYSRAIEELRFMRDEMFESDEPHIWNAFIKQLKEKLLGEKLGGDRREMWINVRKEKLGLIDKTESRFSEVSEDEAQKFLSSR